MSLNSKSGNLLLTIFLGTIILLACRSNRNDNPEILWDNYGVPHIYSTTNQEMYYAFGWAQMNCHADLILKLYAQARGRASEYFGKDYLESDRQILLFDLPGLARENYLKLDGEYKSYLDAFVKGMNDYAKTHADSISEDYRQVLPVTGEDILSHTIRVICLEFLASEDIYSVQRLTEPGSNSMAIASSKVAIRQRYAGL